MSSRGTNELWVIVAGWSKFQHYGTRRDPPWIKQYNELVHRDEYLDLTLAERGLLHGIWSLFALSGGQLRAKTVGQLLRCRPRDEQWKSLSDAGFIRFSASKPLALARSREKEKEKEKKEDRPAPARKPAEPGRINMPATDETAYVRGLVANHVITEPFELDAYNLDDALRAELEAQLQ